MKDNITGNRAAIDQIIKWITPNSQPLPRPCPIQFPQLGVIELYVNDVIPDKMAIITVSDEVVKILDWREEELEA